MRDTNGRCAGAVLPAQFLWRGFQRGFALWAQARDEDRKRDWGLGQKDNLFVGQAV